MTYSGAYSSVVLEKPKRRNRKEERRTQKAIAAYLAQVLPPEIPWTAINPNTMPLPVGVAKNHKDMGVKRNWPDILIVWRRRAILFEVKRPADLISAAGDATKAQRELHDLLRLQGCVVTVVEGIDEVREILNVLGVPTREAA